MDPHPALFAEWQRLREEYNALDSETPEAKAIFMRMEEVEELTRSTVAATPEGVAAQFDFMVEHLMEGGTYCATTKEVAQPFFEVFRTGLKANWSERSQVGTPMAALFAQWAQYWSWLNINPHRDRWTDAEWDMRYDILLGIESRMEAAPVQRLEDIALRFAAMTSFGAVTFTGNQFEREIVAFHEAIRALAETAAPTPACTAVARADLDYELRVEAKVDAVLRCLKGQRAVDRIDARFATEARG